MVATTVAAKFLARHLRRPHPPPPPPPSARPRASPLPSPPYPADLRRRPGCDDHHCCRGQAPDVTLAYFVPAGELKTVSVLELTKGKNAIFFAVPGPFTPTCSQKHLPGFVEKAGELKAKGVDTIACVSVNDAFVMRAWKESLEVGDEVLLLADGNGDFTRALVVELDLRDKPAGLGVRSRRYAMLAEDGVVKVLNLEEGWAFTFSSADDMLKAL